MVGRPMGRPTTHHVRRPAVARRRRHRGLAIHRRTPRPFSPRQIELVTTFADQAVIAINNVDLFEEVQARTRELQETLEYQTATSEVLNVISRSPTDANPVFSGLLRVPRAFAERRSVWFGNTMGTFSTMQQATTLHRRF